MNNIPAPQIEKSQFCIWPWIYGFLVFIALWALAGLLNPQMVRSPKKNHLLEAQENSKIIGLALLDFEELYGTIPNESIMPEVKRNTGSALRPDTKSSNDFFRQLIAAEVAQREDMFYAYIPRSRKPDNLITDSQSLEKGECGFSYLISASKGSPPETPVVVTPLISGKALFDYQAAKNTFSGKAIILRLDGSIQTVPIDKSGRVWINGKDLFDPTQPFWNGKPPTIKWPDL